MRLYSGQPLERSPLSTRRLWQHANRQNVMRMYFRDYGAARGLMVRPDTGHLNSPLMSPGYPYEDMPPFGHRVMEGIMGGGTSLASRALGGLGAVVDESVGYAGAGASRYALAAICGRTLGDLGALVTPASVQAQISTIDAAMRQTAIDVGASSLTGPDAQAWNSFFQSWQKFSGQDVNLLNAGSMADQADGFETTLGQWQTRLTKDGVTITSQPLPSPPASPLDALSKIAVMGVVIAGAWVLIEGMRTARAFK